MSSLGGSGSEVPLGDALFGAFARHAHDLVAVFDVSARCVYVSPSHRRALGYREEDLLGHGPLEFVHPADATDVQQAFETQIASGKAAPPVAFRCRHRDGSWRHLEASATNLLDDPTVKGIVVISRDVTERNEAERYALEQAALLEQVAGPAPLHETLTGVAGLVERWVSDARVAIVQRPGGRARFRVLAAPRVPAACVRAIEAVEYRPSAASTDSREFLVIDLDLEIAYPALRAALLAHGIRGLWARVLYRPEERSRLGALLLYRTCSRAPEGRERQVLDVAARAAALALVRTRSQARLTHQARQDPLTGLANRTELHDRLTRLPDEANGCGGVLYVDLDRFKVVNDEWGHAVGDAVLRRIASRLLTTVHPGDFAARGGDEFVLICPHLDSMQTARRLARRILRTICKPIVLDGRVLRVTASLGIALYHGGEPEKLLNDAKQHMGIPHFSGHLDAPHDPWSRLG